MNEICLLFKTTQNYCENSKRLSTNKKNEIGKKTYLNQLMRRTVTITKRAYFTVM